jgi:hypothetical protein
VLSRMKVATVLALLATSTPIERSMSHRLCRPGVSRSHPG